MTTAEKLAAHPRFSWRAGMIATLDLADDWIRLLRVADDGGSRVWTHEDHTIMNEEDGDLFPTDANPHLADPATAGALLADLFTLRPDTTVGIDPHGDYNVRTNSISYRAATLGEAVAMALLAVWR